VRFPLARLRVSIISAYFTSGCIKITLVLIFLPVETYKRNELRVNKLVVSRGRSFNANQSLALCEFVSGSYEFGSSAKWAEAWLSTELSAVKAGAEHELHDLLSLCWLPSFRNSGTTTGAGVQRVYTTSAGEAIIPGLLSVWARLFNPAADPVRHLWSARQ
jgi:hypothetical protein